MSDDPAALAMLLIRAHRVTISRGGVCDGRLLGGEVLLDTRDSDVVDAVRRTLTVSDLPGFVCMCLGDLGLRFSDAAGETLAIVGYHLASTIRWSGWGGDAVLADGPALLHLLAAHGVTGPLQQHEAESSRLAEDRRAHELWTLAIPRAAADLADALLATSQTGHVPAELIEQVRKRLAVAIPSPAVRTLALLAWYGSGTGRISGCPVHETIPGRLLADIPIADIVKALSRPDVRPRHELGAVRHLAGARHRESSQLPSDLRSRLLTTAETIGLPDNLHAARRFLR